VLVVLLVFGPNLVDTKVEIVFSQPSQVLGEEEVSMVVVI
jgi:hypothetical protein